MGLIGGGPGAFIGEVHRKASRMDGEIELVAGAFDIDPQKSKDMGKNLALDPKRVYSDYTAMIKAEAWQPQLRVHARATAKSFGYTALRVIASRSAATKQSHTV